MDLGLRDRVAIVAAASSGLGKATALELAKEGARVVICSRSEEQLRKASGEIQEAAGVEPLAITCDVTKEEQVRRLVDESYRQFGQVDVLVANAGGPPPGVFEDFTAQHFRDAVELNLISIINLCSAVVPRMRERRWGRIVAVASVAAKQPVENLILSNTARAGALGFLKSLSQQVAADGITVNAICPGYHMTERLKGLGALTAHNESVSVEEIYERWSAATPMKRLGDPAEFAAVVAFFCSQRASYVTGTVLQVDGGVYKGLI